MSDPSGYEDVLNLDESADAQQPTGQREDYLVKAPRSQIRTLQDQAKRGRDAETRAERAERELAFMRAGIDLTTERGQFFAQGYDGELTPEAIRAKAQTVGALDAAPAPTEENAGEEADQATSDTPLEEGEGDLSNVRNDLAQGAPADEQAPAEPYQEAERVYENAMAEGAPWRVAVGGAINSLANAAQRGDQRVILGRHGGARE